MAFLIKCHQNDIIFSKPFAISFKGFMNNYVKSNGALNNAVFKRVLCSINTSYCVCDKKSYNTSQLGSNDVFKNQFFAHTILVFTSNFCKHKHRIFCGFFSHIRTRAKMICFLLKNNE